MYAVVGCNGCGTMWLLSNPADSKTAQCPRCQKTHQTRKLKRFFESEDRAAAREARAAILAKKRGSAEEFADVAHSAELERLVEESGIDDREYLEASGLDADAVEAAGDVTANRPASKSRDELVREAVREAGDGDLPTESEIVAYAADRDVPAERVADLLDRLVRRGDVSESRGRYRLL